MSFLRICKGSDPLHKVAPTAKKESDVLFVVFLATGNGSCVTRRGPYFGLGKPAIELSIIRSADSLICPTTQGGAYARCTRVRLPWATVLNAFGVSAPRIGSRSRTPVTYSVTVHGAERRQTANER